MKLSVMAILFLFLLCFLIGWCQEIFPEDGWCQEIFPEDGWCQEIFPEDEDCRQVEINPSIEDHTLTGHVFKSMVIQDSSACDVNCFIENDCVSFNVKPLQNGDYLCELSDSCDVVHPEDLKEQQGTVYTSFMNPCSSNPCPVIMRCQTGFTDEGYRCVCKNGLLGQNCDESLPVVQVFPDKIAIEERNDVIMMCTVTGNPTPGPITWSKSQGSLPASRNIVKQGRLTITKVTTDDSGLYMCRATNVWGPTTASVQLRVYTALKFINKPPSTVTVKADEMLRLACSVSSDLQPTISWLFDGIPSLPQGTTVDASQELTIMSANFSHGGNYTCNATNSLNSIHTSVTVFVKYPETCSKVKTEISIKSGDYLIDPDGVQGENPFSVYCNMTDKEGIGVTVVSHDSENRTHVKGFEGAGNYSRDIQYIGASLTQLKGLTEASKSCEQFIKFECLSALLGKNDHGYWLSRDGEKMTYWGGATYGNRCACGMNNSCANPHYFCNCDKNDYTWREDSGLLSNKSHLPVSQLRFGDTGHDGEEGYHTLGKLKCYGIN